MGALIGTWTGFMGSNQGQFLDTAQLPVYNRHSPPTTIPLTLHLDFKKFFKCSDFDHITDYFKKL